MKLNIYFKQKSWVGKIVTNLGLGFQVRYEPGPCSTKTSLA